jgi:hypothetical protein
LDKLNRSPYVAMLCHFLSLLALAMVTYNFTSLIWGGNLASRAVGLLLAMVFIIIFLFFQASAFVVSARGNRAQRPLLLRLELVNASPLPCILYRSKDGSYFLPKERTEK